MTIDPQYQPVVVYGGFTLLALLSLAGSWLMVQRARFWAASTHTTKIWTTVRAAESFVERAAGGAFADITAKYTSLASDGSLSPADLVELRTYSLQRLKLAFSPTQLVTALVASQVTQATTPAAIPPTTTP